MDYTIPSDTMLVILGCSFGATFVGLICGFFIGRWYTLAHEPRKLRKNRERTMAALTSLLTSTDKLNEDVDCHNAALVEVEKDISQIDSDDGAFDSLRSRLLSDITTMVHSNRKLESELVQSRYQLHQQSEELDKRKREARTDTLCQTGNRKAFDEAMQYMFARRSSKGGSFALMLIDVDNFKRINDTFGHSSGDAVLINIGNALKACIRPGDVVCRLGGDEFAIILDKTGPEEVALVGSRIRSTIEQLDFLVDEAEGQRTVVTLSMGLTAVDQDDDALSLYDRADEALYDSKSHGRNRLSIRSGETTLDSVGAVALDDSPQKSYEEIKAEILSES